MSTTSLNTERSWKIDPIKYWEETEKVSIKKPITTDKVKKAAYNLIVLTGKRIGNAGVYALNFFINRWNSFVDWTRKTPKPPGGATNATNNTYKKIEISEQPCSTTQTRISRPAYSSLADIDEDSPLILDAEPIRAPLVGARKTDVTETPVLPPALEVTPAEPQVIAAKTDVIATPVLVTSSSSGEVSPELAKIDGEIRGVVEEGYLNSPVDADENSIFTDANRVKANIETTRKKTMDSLNRSLQTISRSIASTEKARAALQAFSPSKSNDNSPSTISGLSDEEKAEHKEALASILSKYNGRILSSEDKIQRDKEITALKSKWLDKISVDSEDEKEEISPVLVSEISSPATTDYSYLPEKTPSPVLTTEKKQRQYKNKLEAITLKYVKMAINNDGKLTKEQQIQKTEEINALNLKYSTESTPKKDGSSS